MAEAIPQPPNMLGSAASLISQLAPIFLGSGKTTTNSATSASPGALALNNQVINQALGNANDPDATNDIVANIMRQAAIAFAPVVGQQNNAGMYNTQTLALLAQQAQANATGQAAQAVLNFKTSQEQIAAGATAAGLNANKTTTQTQQTAPVVDPTLSLLAAGGNVALQGAKLLFPQQTAALGDKAISGVKSLFGLNNPPAGAAGGPGANEFLKGVKLDDTISGGSPVSPVATESLGSSTGIGGGANLGTSDIDVSGGFADAGGGFGSVSSADASSFLGTSGIDVSGGFADSVGSGVADSFSSLADTGGSSLASSAADLGTSNIDVSGGFAESAADPFSVSSTSASAASDILQNTGDDLGGALGSAGASAAGDVGADLGTSAIDVSGGFAEDTADLVASGADVGNLGGEIASGIGSTAAGLAGGISAVGSLIHLGGSLLGGDEGTAVEAVGDLLSPQNGIADVGAAIGGAIGGGVGDAITFITDPIGSIVGGSVACTVLHAQGKLSDRLYYYNISRFSKIPERSKNAYWLWARPLANYLKNNPTTFRSRCIGALFTARAEFIAKRYGNIRGTQIKVTGALATGIVFAITVACGLWNLIRGFKGE